MSPCRAIASPQVSMSLSACGTTQTLNAFQDAINMGVTNIALHTRSDEQLLDAIQFVSSRSNLDGLDIIILKSKRSFSNGDIIDGRYAIRFVTDRRRSFPQHCGSRTVTRFSAFRTARVQACRAAMAA